MVPYFPGSGRRITASVIPNPATPATFCAIAANPSKAHQGGDAPPEFPTQMVCDLAEAEPFSPFLGKPHAPILGAFGGDRLHQCSTSGSYDVERALNENYSALYRSKLKLSAEDHPKAWDDLTFRVGPRTFVYIDGTQIKGFAETAGEAERLVTSFNTRYSKPAAPKAGCFNLIKMGRDIDLEEVPLDLETVLGEEAFSLHYGTGSIEWHQSFTEKLRKKRHGLSILEGEPGTGKSSYLRHLMGELKDSHRFYFIPPTTMGVLSNPEFVGFWAEERRQHKDQKFVVILEDCDTALMTRGTDNSQQVSAILNLSDGMMADFIRLHILCTINCKAVDIDQALLRPGRLICHRIFRRLEHPEAVRLAASLGRSLPSQRDYSLAEIFAEDAPEAMRRPRIGFGG